MEEIVHFLKQPQVTAKERYASGEALRKKVPLVTHAEWNPPKERADPVRLIEEQNEDRLPWLVPVRRTRMSVSPFTFYRGAARIMAADLSSSPVSGLTTQLCGDAHLGNFGGYASPERQFVFDLNDFDETLPGPWEWDIKRLAVSFFIAGRYNGLSKKESRKLCARTVKAYRKAMEDFAKMRYTDIWYSLVNADDMMETADATNLEEFTGDIIKQAKKRDHRHSLDQLAEKVNGQYRIKSEPPLLVPFRDIAEKVRGDKMLANLESGYNQYLEKLTDDVAHHLRQYTPVDFALKIVGVGSVATRCAILLLQGRDKDDPLFLQIKEANASVLEEFLPGSQYNDAGQRVVEGQRLMQSVSDIFLGSTISEATNRHFYWRQLKDWKGAMDIENVGGKPLKYAATLRGKVLANAHARSGDPIAIAGYLGGKKEFDQALTVFSERYAKQNEADYQKFMKKIEKGELATVQE